MEVAGTGAGVQRSPAIGGTEFRGYPGRFRNGVAMMRLRNYEGRASRKLANRQGVSSLRVEPV